MKGLTRTALGCPVPLPATLRWRDRGFPMSNFRTNGRSEAVIARSQRGHDNAFIFFLYCLRLSLKGQMSDQGQVKADCFRLIGLRHQRETALKPQISRSTTEGIVTLHGWLH